MSDTVVVALIGVAGTVVGSGATILVALLQSRKRHDPPVPPGKVVDPTPVLGEAVDIRELRILRALYGEPRGRPLDAYKDAYYRRSLEATLKKGWVRLEARRYHLTDKGADFCWAYVKQLHQDWRPVPAQRAELNRKGKQGH
jgi:hypothetical protein